MNSNQLLTFIFLIFFSSVAVAQDEAPSQNVAIGEWRAYLPYTIGNYVTQNASTVFYASDFSLLAIDKVENSVERLTKVNGLSDVEISLLKHSPFNDVLIAVYENRNIDFITPDGTINFPFVKDKNVAGDQTIYDITFVTPNRVFLSAGFGILELDPETTTVNNDIRTGIAVTSFAALDGFFYAATEEGIYVAEDDPSVNLLDFTNNWRLLDDSDGFPLDYSSNAVFTLDDQLVVDVNDSLFFYKNGLQNNFYHKEGFTIEFLSAEGAQLLVGLDCEGCVDNLAILEKDGSLIRELGSPCVLNIQSAVQDAQGRVWIADRGREFRVLQNINGNCTLETYEGVASGNIWDLEVRGDELWVATGGFNVTNGYLFRQDGVLRLQENGSWIQYTRNNREEFGGEDRALGGGDDIFDFTTITASPTEEKVYLGSYMEGVLEFDLEADEMTLFNEHSSLLSETIGDPNRSRTGGIALDSDENVWVTSYLGEDILSVLVKETGNVVTFPSAKCGGFSEILDVVIDGAGNKWMRVASSGAGLIVFNEFDLNDSNDDRCRFLSTNNSFLPSNDVLSLEVDLDGDVWVGTANGVIIFQCGSQVFDPEICGGFIQAVDVGGDLDELLEGESVQAIAVDGANRKWFGTTNGVFLQSEDGKDLLASFTETNSPLFDNNIIDIEVRQETGEVFIGTARGLQSIRTDATAGGVINSQDVNVFPNPVRPDYEGPIAINGLARDANVKITDITGRLIFETEALGGQAIWDGRDYNGRKASSGVYLVISTATRNFDNPQTAVAKIMIVN